MKRAVCSRVYSRSMGENALALEVAHASSSSWSSSLSKMYWHTAAMSARPLTKGFTSAVAPGLLPVELLGVSPLASLAPSVGSFFAALASSLGSEPFASLRAGQWQ